MAKFNNGDKVQLASGGPIMTIENPADKAMKAIRLLKGDGAIRCVWFDKEGNYKENIFLEESLIAAPNKNMEDRL